MIMNDKNLTEEIKKVLNLNYDKGRQKSHINVAIFCDHHKVAAQRVTTLMNSFPEINVYCVDGNWSKPLIISMQKEFE